MAEVITKTYLDHEGLQHYDSKIKKVISDGDTKVLNDAKQYADNLSSNYDPAGTAATKVKELADGAVKTNTDAITKLNGGADVEGSVDKKIADERKKIDTAIADAVANANHLKREIVEQLPEVGSANEHTIYMVSKKSGSGEQKYDEYMLVNGALEKIGDSAVDLTNYAKKTEVETAKNEAISTAGTNADSKISTKVGEIGEKTVKVYVDEAKQAAVTESNNYTDGLAKNYGSAADVTKLKTDVGDIQTSLAPGGATSNAIADAKKAGTDAQDSVKALGTRVESLENVKFERITEVQIDALFG